MIITKKLLTEAEEFTKDLTNKNKDRFTTIKFADVRAGDLIQFPYSAKNAGTLAFWDGKPAIIVLRKTGSRMLGLNLHFVPFRLRKIIAEFVINKNKANIAANKRMYIDYTLIKSLLVAIKATVCIRMYLPSHMGSPILTVKNTRDYVLGATLLKTEKLYKMSSDQIYKIALGQEYSTKKKVGQRKTDRAKNKAIKKKYF